jgi:hypothetical protein
MLSGQMNHGIMTRNAARADRFDCSSKKSAWGGRRAGTAEEVSFYRE